MAGLYPDISINIVIILSLVPSTHEYAPEEVPFYMRKLPGNYRKVVVEEISFRVCPDAPSKNSTAQNNARQINTRPQFEPQNINNNLFITTPDKYKGNLLKDGLQRDNKVPKNGHNKSWKPKENKGGRRRRKRFAINYRCPKDKSVDKTDHKDSDGDGDIAAIMDLEGFGHDGPVFNKPSLSKIVGGDTAQGSWPSLVSVQYLGLDLEWHHFCGGSLIQTHWIVTAAHCVSHIENFYIRVVLGDHQLSKFSHREQVLEPDRIFMHKNFNESSYHFDIAMIKLQTDARITRYVDTIDVANEEEAKRLDDQDECFIAGWGNMIGTVSEMFLSDELQYSQMWVLSNSQCQSRVASLVPESQICLYSDEASACKGDSGGPVVCRTGSEWTLVGAASYICSPTCEPMNPNVYTLVSFYVYWMACVIQQYDTALLQTYRDR